MEEPVFSSPHGRSREALRSLVGETLAGPDCHNARIHEPDAPAAERGQTRVVGGLLCLSLNPPFATAEGGLANARVSAKLLTRRMLSVGDPEVGRRMAN